MPLSLIQVLMEVGALIGIIIGSVVALIGLVFLLFFFGKKRYTHAYFELQKKYSDVHNILVTDCQGMITRLGALGQYSTYYRNLHDERYKQYKDIVNKRDKDMAVSLESLKTLLEDKNYKSAKEVQEQCQISLLEFQKSVSSFNDDLNSLLRDENDTRESALPDKEMYRKIKDIYSKNQAELKPLEKSFNIIFANSEKTFSSFDVLANEAKFKEAKALLPDLEKVLKAVLAIIDDLPVLETKITKVIPAKVVDLKNSYDEMLKENYILDYLQVDEKIAEITALNEQLGEQMRLLDTSGVNENLDKIQDEINNILFCFDDEKKAKADFLSNQNTLSCSSFELEKEYSTHMRLLPKFQSTYVLNKKYVDQMIALKNDIENTGYLKRELDSYLDTSSKQPYTVITKKMHDMQNSMDKIKKTMADYSLYLASLKDESEKVYLGLRENYVKLRISQSKLRHIAVNSLILTYNPSYERLYKKIIEIDNILLTPPVDVTKAMAEYLPFVEETDALINEVIKKSDEADKAEMAFVYANAYRQEFSNSRAFLETAEQAYNEGDFQRALSASVQVVQAFSTDDSASLNGKKKR